MTLNNLAGRIGSIALLVLLTCGSVSAGPLFQPSQTYPSGGLMSYSIAVGDMNGDGKPDLVVANECLPNTCHGGIGILLGNGDGTFQPAKIFDSGQVFADSIAVADVNRDGKLDVLILTGANCPPQPCFSLVSVLFGNGDGTLGAPHVYSSGGFVARKLAVADVNGDGKVDLLVANGAVNPDLSGNGSVGVLLGNGDGTFRAAQTFDSGSWILMSLAVADVNGDGKLDVITIHQFALAGVLLGNGDGTFQAAQTYSSGAVTAESIAVADVNEDGKPDLLVANTVADFNGAAAGVLLANADGTFQAAQNYSTGAFNVTSIAAADVNGDGHLDLLLAHQCRGTCNGVVTVLLGNGNGTFRTALRYSSGGSKPHEIVVSDVNGDRKPDVLVANECLSYTDCSSGGAGVLLGLAGVRTATTLASSLDHSIYGQNVTWTSKVTTSGPFAPTGRVYFSWKGNSIGFATLDASGLATLSRRNLNASVYPLTAVYKGDASNAGSTSAIVNQVVEQTSSAATIISSANPSTRGQLVTFTAKITSPTVIATGPVTFTAGSTVLGTAQLLFGGKATLSTSALPVGSTKITVTYYGDSNIAKSSVSLTQTVQ